MKKHLTAEERAMRRTEMARRRKNLSEKRNEEEKVGGHGLPLDVIERTLTTKNRWTPSTDFSANRLRNGGAESPLRRRRRRRRGIKRRRRSRKLILSSSDGSVATMAADSACQTNGLGHRQVVLSGTTDPENWWKRCNCTDTDGRTRLGVIAN